MFQRTAYFFIILCMILRTDPRLQVVQCRDYAYSSLIHRLHLRLRRCHHHLARGLRLWRIP